MSLDLEMQDELTTLKARADMMGLKYHPNISLERLKERVNEAIEAPAPSGEALGGPVAMSPEEERKWMILEQTRLIRVRVTCLNPAKKDWFGEVFTVSNAVIPTISKFVPFNLDTPYHVPKMILSMMQERVFPSFYTVQLPNGQKTRKTRLAKEFAIEILPDLTKEELEELARQQALNRSLDDVA